MNNAEIFQTSASGSWSPVAGGVVLINEGSVINCINNGKVTTVSTNDEVLSTVYAGGIAAINYKSIEKSKNNADITGLSKNYVIYVGGIAALSDSVNAAEIKNSCSYGNIYVESEKAVFESDGNERNVFLFAGGIAGFSSGNISNSYSASVIGSANDNVFSGSEIAEDGNAFLGGIMGCGYYYSTSVNNYYITRSNIEYGAATVLSDAYYSGSDVGITAVADLAAIKALEVYWG